MAIEEHDREDLLGDGRNMPWRGQCLIEGAQVVVGFRAQGQVSLFCGFDPVFQFNSSQELRRVFFAGIRYRAERGRLISMLRDSSGGKIHFVESIAEPSTEVMLGNSLQSWLDLIRPAIDASPWRVEGESVDRFRIRLRDWFDRLPSPISIASVANA